MPYVTARDGTRLYYEQTGSGTPLVFVHEFGGDCRSWEPQVRFFSRRYRCVAYNARGYPPSDVPRARAKYSQAIVVDDLRDLMRELGVRKAHVVGCSMGASTTLNFGIRYPVRALSLTSISAGAGSNPATRRQFLKQTLANAERFERLGMPAALRGVAVGPGRVPQKNKDPRSYAEFERQRAQHSGLGLANTQRGVQLRRPTIYQLERGLRRLRVPLLVIAGDEDDACVAPGVFMKQVCPSARLWICPGTGHAVNAEEPELLNHMLLEFFLLVESGRWRPRDPASVVARR